MSTSEPHTAGPILFCFDGSEGSRQALAEAAALLVPRAAVVLSVWETITVRLMTTGFFPATGMSYVADEGDLDAQEEAAARQAAQDGARVANDHGWVATARVENAELAIWRTIVEVADEIDASLIVSGARGLNTVKRAIIGSVSEAVLHHSHRPTLITTQPRADG
jgi:nucleotide-binding universal stress UspA family protein